MFIKRPKPGGSLKPPRKQQPDYAESEQHLKGVAFLTDTNTNEPFFNDKHRSVFEFCLAKRPIVAQSRWWVNLWRNFGFGVDLKNFPDNKSKNAVRPRPHERSDWSEGVYVTCVHS